MLRNSSVAERLAASQEALSSMEVVIPHFSEIYLVIPVISSLSIELIP
jgi:hypothetical protein